MNDQKPRRPWRRTVIASLIATTVAAFGVAGYAYAHGGGRGGWHGGMSDADPQTQARRVDGMLRFWLADVDASDAQRKQIADIVTTAMRELQPLREQHREARKQAMEILAKPQVDRAALEAIRQKELQLGDQLSRRMVQSLADAAEVLTPEQRAKVAEKMAQRRERHRRG
jgi:Spy/CpxP family protein refolding chaperone